MAGLSLTLEFEGDVQLNRRLLRIGDRAVNCIPVFEELRARFYEVETEQFESEGKFSGGWAPLAKATIEKKARLNLDPRILHETLALRRSLTIPDAPGGQYRITPNELALGTSVRSKKGYPYARAHQQGRGVPQRRPVDLTELERRLWVKAVQRWVLTGELLGVKAKV